jgi:hypothetical protein
MAQLCDMFELPERQVAGRSPWLSVFCLPFFSSLSSWAYTFPSCKRSSRGSGSHDGLAPLGVSSLLSSGAGPHYSSIFSFFWPSFLPATLQGQKVCGDLAAGLAVAVAHSEPHDCWRGAAGHEQGKMCSEEVPAK